jgi:UDP-glucose 4-epimerase
VYLTDSLLRNGYSVTVLDKDTESLRDRKDKGLILIEGILEDRETVKKAVKGADAVIHLAWSFTTDPMEVLDVDLKGHINLLEEMDEQKTGHLVYTSTAVVYGKPRYSPIDEDHPLIVEEARKPLYGIAKAAAEKLCLMYWKERGLPATVIRFWWAFGDDIGGRHLREMLRTAAAGEPLEFPGDSGGSFLYLQDFEQGVQKCLFKPAAYGQTFNLATVYITWDEVAGIVREVTASTSEIRSIPSSEWKGSAFLADPWELDDTLARQLVGYAPTEADKAKALLKKAIAARWEGMKSS